MIIYTAFWETLRKRGISTYALINKHHISSSTLTRLRTNKPLSTVTINDLCRILGCGIEEIAQYTSDEGDQEL